MSKATPDWLLHFRHAHAHMVAATNLLAIGDRWEALRHITEMRRDIRWCERQLREDLHQTEVQPIP